MRTSVTPPARVLLLSIVAAAGVFLTAQEPSPTRPRTLVAGARILDAVEGTYGPPSFVLLEGQRIASIGEDQPAVLDDTRTIDGKGLTIVAGLVDAHAQVAPTDDLDADYFALMSLAYGVTAVRGINVRTAWGVAQRERLAGGRAIGPRLFTSGQGIDQEARPDLWLLDAPSPAAAAAEAARQAAAGVDWVAGYSHVTPEAYRAMAAAVAGTSARIAARPGASSISDLAAARVASIETLDFPLARQKPASAVGPTDPRWPAMSARDSASLARALVQQQITLVPLLAASMLEAYPQEVAANPALARLPAARRAQVIEATKAIRWPEIAARRKDWTARAAFLARFVAAGGRVVAGTGFEDSGYPPPGAGLHAELAALVRAGLTPADAIRAATVNGAEMLGAGALIGAVRQGLASDLILVEGDPLSSVRDLARIKYVIRAGEVLEPKALVAEATAAAAGRPK